MIIVQLNGGLGNQLFQYALGRRLAFERNVPLKLDITALQKDTLRSYELHHFNVIETFATSEEVRSFVNSSFVNRLYRRVQRQFLPYRFRSWVKEKSFAYDQGVLASSSRVYLEGYWQSEKYFTSIEPIIRSEFTFKNPPDPTNAAFIELIGSKEAVSVHIRRGDYAVNAMINQIHGLLPLDYYYKAISRIVQRLQHPHFFIFSDDPEWVRTHFQLEYPVTYISHNGATGAHVDLRLMSVCKHHIIANSSFSWWGAWLSTYPEKMVLCPAKWANLPSLNTQDRIPDGWERII